MNALAPFERDGHWTFVMRHRRAVRIVELPTHTPPVGSQLRYAPGEFDGGRVEMRKAAFGVGRIDGRRERVYHFAESALAFAQSPLSFAAHAMELQMRLHPGKQL